MIQQSTTRGALDFGQSDVHQFVAQEQMSILEKDSVEVYQIIMSYEHRQTVNGLARAHEMFFYGKNAVVLLVVVRYRDCATFVITSNQIDRLMANPRTLFDTGDLCLQSFFDR